jgi:branched-chain amino acid transport system substrate-binding protein
LLWIGAATGAAKLYGLGQLHGLKSAVSYINSHGGMAGHQINLVLSDDGSDPTTAVTHLLNYLSTHPAPNAVWAGSESDETGALLPVLAQKKVFGYAQTDGPRLLESNAGAKYPYQFNPGGPPTLADQTAAAWFASEHFHKVGILQEQLDFTASETPVIAGLLHKEGIATAVATFGPTLTDVTPEVAALKSDGADALFVEVLGPADGYALLGRAKLGWAVPVLGDEAFAAIDATKLVPAADLKQVSILADRAAPASANYPAVKLFKSYMDPTGGVGGDGISSEAAAWDSTMTVYTAAKQANAITTPALAQAMDNLQTTVEPYYVTVHAEQFNSNTHEDAAATPADYTVIPAGPFVDGQVQ